GEHDEHGVDRARVDEVVELLDREHAAARHAPYVIGSSGVTYAAVMPPSTTSDAPVMNDESSDARNSAALASSSACPSRPIGSCTMRRARRTGSERSSASSGVS